MRVWTSNGPSESSPTRGRTPIRLLLDQNTPHGLRTAITGHEVRTAYQTDWDLLQNGNLIAAAEQEGFDVIVTCDQSIEHQQNLTKRRLAMVVLTANRWPVVHTNLIGVQAAIDASTAGSYQMVEFERPPLLRRPPPTLDR